MPLRPPIETEEQRRARERAEAEVSRSQAQVSPFLHTLDAALDPGRPRPTITPPSQSIGDFLKRRVRFDPGRVNPYTFADRRPQPPTTPVTGPERESVTPVQTPTPGTPGHRVPLAEDFQRDFPSFFSDVGRTLQGAARTADQVVFGGNLGISAPRGPHQPVQLSPSAAARLQPEADLADTPPEERTPNQTQQAIAAAIPQAEEAMRTGKTPDAKTVQEVVAAATEVQSQKPMSKEEKKSLWERTRKFVERMKANDRIDLLAAGLSILQNSDKSSSTGAIVGHGLLTGLQVATENRQRAQRAKLNNLLIGIKAFEAQNDMRRTDAYTRQAKASELSAQAAALKAMRESGKMPNPTANQTARASAAVKSVMPDSEHQEVLIPAAAQVMAMYEQLYGRSPSHEELLKEAVRFANSQQNAGIVGGTTGFFGFGDSILEVEEDARDPDLVDKIMGILGSK